MLEKYANLKEVKDLGRELSEEMTRSNAMYNYSVNIDDWSDDISKAEHNGTVVETTDKEMLVNLKFEIVEYKEHKSNIYLIDKYFVYYSFDENDLIEKQIYFKEVI